MYRCLAVTNGNIVRTEEYQYLFIQKISPILNVIKKAFVFLFQLSESESNNKLIENLFFLFLYLTPTEIAANLISSMLFDKKKIYLTVKP